MAVVVLPRSLIALFPGADRRVTIDGATIVDVIDALDARWPGVRDRLCDPGPTLRRYINVYVDGRPADLDTPVGPASTVHVLPAVAGGCAAGQATGSARAWSWRSNWVR
ncbi:MAG: MoaD/ThiS family protein [Candidatus Limnocylindrales bacterium]